jgi:hypothetical protein
MTEEDEAFEELERAQQKAVRDKSVIKPYGYVRADANGLFIYGEHQFSNPHDHALTPIYTKDVFLQLIKELRPAIKPLEGLGKGKTTEEWFDILVKDIEEKL